MLRLRVAADIGEGQNDDREMRCGVLELDQAEIGHRQLEPAL
jgi:hypothetical protein